MFSFFFFLPVLCGLRLAPLPPVHIVASLEQLLAQISGRVARVCASPAPRNESSNHTLVHWSASCTSVRHRVMLCRRRRRLERSDLLLFLPGKGTLGAEHQEMDE
uniref:Putative secreted protein n=1 Tax=Anopheles marajoara TaxID=58244 RepID=A0A2M4C8D2_9DIPT